VVLLAGEPGIGKTALAAQVAADAVDRGARVLWASCPQDAGAPGYWPWVQAVRRLAADAGADHARRIAADAPALARLVPELADQAGAPVPSGDRAPEAARFQLFDELSSVLLAEAAAAPLVVVPSTTCSGPTPRRCSCCASWAGASTGPPSS
jgi:hypothetical protein